MLQSHCLQHKWAKITLHPYPKVSELFVNEVNIRKLASKQVKEY
jgi:hypothetical protein